MKFEIELDDEQVGQMKLLATELEISPDALLLAMVDNALAVGVVGLSLQKVGHLDFESVQDLFAYGIERGKKIMNRARAQAQ